MNIVIPMAGLGARFRNAGFTTAKPLIPVLGRPMYAWAVESLPLNQASSITFVLLRSQPEYAALSADVRFRYREYEPTVLDVPEPTSGQAVTVLGARACIDNGQPLLIHNSDTAFEADPHWVQQALRDRADGALLVFESNDPRWSYAREAGDGRVVEVREKQVISRWATTGTYWFRCGRDFVRLARRRVELDLRDAGEFYVGPLYNDLVAEGWNVRCFPVRKLYCFGTPEDLERSLRELGKIPDRCQP